MTAVAARDRLQDLLGGVLTVRALIALLASRVVVRGTLSLAPLVVRPAWTEAEFAAYAAAMARFVFVVPLLSGGVEKSVLKLLPRARRAASPLVVTYLALLATLVAGIVAWIAVTAAGTPTARLIVLAGAFAVLLGVNQVLVSVHRALGRVVVDVADQLTVFAILAAGLASAWWGGATPEGLLAGWVVGMAALDLVVAVALPRPHGARRRPPRRLVRFVVRDASLQGSTDVLTGLSVALLFAAVTLTDRRGELPELYVVLNLATMVTTGYTYLMRVLQPSVALRLRARPGRIAGGSAWLGPRALAVAVGWWAVVLVTARWLVETGRPPGEVWWLAAAFLALLPLLTTVAALHFVFENGDHATLRTTVRGAAAGFVTLLVVVLPLVAWAGAVGAVAALAAGELAHLAVLARAVARGRGAPSPAAVRS